MKILYISGLYSEELLPYFDHNIKGCRLQHAANTFQYAILEGLVENDADFYVLSFPFLPCFPHHFKSNKVPTRKITYEGKVVGESVGYFTHVLFKPLSIRKKLRQNVQLWLQNNIDSDEPFCVLVYSYEYYLIEPLLALKSKYPNMQIVSIITDLHGDAKAFGSNHSFLKRIQLSIVNLRKTACVRLIDRSVLLTPHMVEKLPNAESNHIVIEGIYRNSENISSDIKWPKTLLYTGSFQEFAGVKLLADAFMATSDPTYRLILCGSGPDTDYINTCAKTDSRIDNLGRVSREDSVRLQKSVSLLVNPRQPNDGITKYSFPSKTMEYMSSGTPMIGYRLEGIPDEYFEYMVVPEDLSVEALTSAIEHELSMPEDYLSEKGEDAKRFILENKSAKAQVAKIINFINNG